MIIMKFGGSSVRDGTRIRRVADLVEARLDRRPILVFSALGGMTEALARAGEEALDGRPGIEAIRDHHLSVAEDLGVDPVAFEPLLARLEDLVKGISLIGELSERTSDHLLSFGERLSVRLIARYLRVRGIRARHFDGWEAGLVTDSGFGRAEVLPDSEGRITRALSELLTGEAPEVPVVTGFIAKDRAGRITTLGRGGSDLTASVLGAALCADEIQVWKDVDGILSSDPRLVPGARPVPEVSYEEAAELAYFGAEVLHPSSIKPAMDRNIPVRVKNSYNPDHPGSVILRQDSGAGGPIKAITCKRKVTLIDVVSSRMLGQYGFLARVFELFKEHRISVDMVATSEVSISLTLDNGHSLTEVRGELESIARVTVHRNKAILSLICDVTRTSRILDRVFAALRALDVNVQMISQGASKVNIGLIVEDDEIEGCMRRIHDEFFPPEGEAPSADGGPREADGAQRSGDP